VWCAAGDGCRRRRHAHRALPRVRIDLRGEGQGCRDRSFDLRFPAERDCAAAAGRNCQKRIANWLRRRAGCRRRWRLPRTFERSRCARCSTRCSRGHPLLVDCGVELWGSYCGAHAEFPALIFDRLASGNLGRKPTELLTLVGAELREHATAAFDVCIDQTCGQPWPCARVPD
jgi:hypothetical protein